MWNVSNHFGREPKFELLRIVAMLLIVASHFWGKCIDLAAIEPFADGYVFGWFIKGASYVNINLYVLLSAYFMCKGTFRVKKLFLLWLEVEFYSLLLFAISILVGWTTFSVNSLLKAVLPVFNSEYWFITIYFGIYLLSPFLNKIIECFSRKQLLALCVTMSVLFCVIPNIFFESIWLNFGSGYGIVWFVTLYFIGGYLKLYDFPIKKHSTIWLTSIILLLLPGISRVFLVLVENWVLGRVVGSGLLFFNNSVTVLPASVFLFIAFAKMDVHIGVRLSETINIFASSSLAVYLIHDNPNIREKIWAWIRTFVDLSSALYPLVFLGAIFSVWLLCSLVDLVRQLLFLPLSKMKLGAKTDKLIYNIFNLTEV